MRNLFKVTLTFAIALLSIGASCLANTFTVTTTNISGLGSLAAAITQANVTPTNNLIRITVTNPIIVGVTLPTITNNVVIVGAANTPAMISGGGTLPLFTFAAETTNSLSNLVIANGYSTIGGAAGAAINNAGVVSITGCVLTNNSATNGFGGAINNGGTMVISSSVIAGDWAPLN